MSQVTCFSCQNNLTFADKPGFRAECSHCRADVHVCKNCKFYDSKVYNECKESQADRIVEKERANYCEFFQARTEGLSELDEKAKLKAMAEALFKK